MGFLNKLGALYVLGGYSDSLRPGLSALPLQSLAYPVPDNENPKIYSRRRQPRAPGRMRGLSTPTQAVSGRSSISTSLHAQHRRLIRFADPCAAGPWVDGGSSSWSAAAATETTQWVFHITGLIPLSLLSASAYAYAGSWPLNFPFPLSLVGCLAPLVPPKPSPSWRRRPDCWSSRDASRPAPGPRPCLARDNFPSRPC